jgi:hypothetical protein
MDVGKRGVLKGLLSVAALGLGAGQARATGAESPRRLNIQYFGDSLAQGLWLSTHPLLRRREHLRALNGTRHATGLTRSDEHDWISVVQQTREREPAECVIVWIGANDFRPFVDRAARARFAFGSAEFQDAYRRSVEAITRTAISTPNNAGGQVGWLGLPNMRDPRFADAARRLNDAIQEGTEAAGGLYIPTWEATSDEEGRFRISIADAERRERRLRADDGVHFSDLGYRMMARLAFEKLGEAVPSMAAQFQAARDAVAA